MHLAAPQALLAASLFLHLPLLTLDLEGEDGGARGREEGDTEDGQEVMA